MKRVLRLTRWFFVTLYVAVTGLFFAHLLLRPSLSHSSAEQYAVYAAYIERGLTGDSHDLGDRRGQVGI